MPKIKMWVSRDLFCWFGRQSIGVVDGRKVDWWYVGPLTIRTAR